MPGKTTRRRKMALLRIQCMLLIFGDHLTGQSGIADYTTLPSSFAFCLIGCGSRIACSVFVLIGGWFLCEQPYKPRRPLSLWLSLWLYTVPVTLLCKLAGLDVSWGALRWAAFPASTRQLWFISDYLLLLLCVPLLNRLLRGLSRPAHRGLLAVLAVPLIVYPTLFGENGAVSDTAWMFLYEYLLIAYLRRWPDNRLAHLLQHRAAALGLGLGLPLLNTILRAVLETRGLTDAAHIVGRDDTGALPQTALIQRADLLGQNDAVLGQPAAVRPHADVRRQAVLVLAACDGCRNDRGAVPVADLILNDKYRTYAPLLGPHDGA